MLIRRLLRAAALLGGLIAAGIAGVAGYAYYASERTLDAPLPPITADQSAAGVARGAAIFHATCEACHRPPGGERASGAPLHDAPEWLGFMHSGNITADRAAGIGAVSDAHLARMIRYGVNRSGHWAPMPAYAMSDADLAAVLGFLRSDDRLFRPDARPAPRTRLSLAGRTVLFLAGAFTPPSRPASGIHAPPRAPTSEYGRYLAEGVYQCGDCHTPGFAADKIHGPDAYAGGTELKNSAGALVLAPNLTRDEHAGIGLWTRDEFALAVRSGIRPDGTALDYPMLRFRGADDLEIDALLAHLRSFAPRSTPVPGRRPAVRAGAERRAPARHRPEQAFTSLGCSGCHGKGALYETKLESALGKPAGAVASWIRNPERFMPGTVMPSFAAVLDEQAALDLAEWIQRGGPKRLASGPGSGSATRAGEAL
jgi:mono/diheme cytochrome c family protein